MNKKDKKEYSIQAVANALRLFDEFRDGEELGVTALSKRLGLHKNNVFRVLATLEQQDYIEQNPTTGGYRLGVGALQLGQAYERSGDLPSRARPIVRELAHGSRETVHLGVLRGHEVTQLDGATAGRPLLAALRVGGRLPAHSTALGKMLLAAGPAERRESYDAEVVGPLGLEARTPATIRDRDKFFEHLRTVAVRGFALDLEEWEPGLVCASAPVFDAEGTAVAALSVSGPRCRLEESTLLQDIVPRVTAAANRLSRMLGYVTA